MRRRPLETMCLVLMTAACFSESGVVTTAAGSTETQADSPSGSSGAATSDYGESDADAEGSSAYGATTVADASSTSTDRTATETGASTSSDGGDASTTASTGTILLYAAPFTAGDFLAGAPFPRAAADELCEAAVPDTAVCDTYHAVLSIMAGDTIGDFDGNFLPPPDEPIQSEAGIEVASAWSSFAGPDPALINSLTFAEVTSTPPWTGSTGAGTLGAHCTTWTNAASDDIGNVGSVSATGADWRSNGDDPCNQLRPVLCACWAE